MKNKKYILTDETRIVNGVILHRIKYIRDVLTFGDCWYKVKAGDLGGWIESEKNLSHKNRCLILDDACVYGNARVCKNGRVWGNALIHDNVTISHHARVWDFSHIYGNTVISNGACMFGNTTVSGYTHINAPLALCGGIWTKEPPYVKINEKYIYLSDNTKGKEVVYSGRHRISIDYWLKLWEEAAQLNKYPAVYVIKMDKYILDAYNFIAKQYDLPQLKEINDENNTQLN